MKTHLSSPVPACPVHVRIDKKQRLMLLDGSKANSRTKRRRKKNEEEEEEEECVYSEVYKRWSETLEEQDKKEKKKKIK